MAKKVDITDKLDLSGNPVLVIRDKEIEVNADAATVIKIMNQFKDSDPEKMSVKDMLDTYETIFPEKSRKDLEKMKLSFSDLTTVIQAAQCLITGQDLEAIEENAGEDQTHTTT